MNFDFSDEQNMLRDQARRLLSDLSSIRDVRRTIDSETGYNKALWHAVVAMGWPAISISETYGGLGLGYVDLCVIAEELGRALAQIPFSSSVFLATEALLLAGTEAQRCHYLPSLANGTAIGTVAMIDAARHPPVSYSNLVLNGTKIVVPEGSYATFAVVSGTEADGLSLFLADLNSIGVNRSVQNTIEPGRNYAQVSLSDVSAQRLGPAGSGQRILDRIHERAAVLFAFEQLGGAQVALDMAVDYAKSRHAFGRPIGSFQAIKHKLADLYCLTELARSNCYYAAWDMSRSHDQLAVNGAAARLSATKAYEQCSRENIHVHGGMGFTWEFDCHLHYRRSKTLALAIGSERHWRQRLMNGLSGARLSEQLA